MSNRVEGERVFCYQCENEWDRAHGGLQCPRCESEFVEILENGRQPEYDDPPEVAPESPMDDDDFHNIRDHNPWGLPSSDPHDRNARSIHLGEGGLGGGTTFQFSRTFTSGLGGPRQQHRQQGFDSGGQDPAADEVMRNFEQMVNGILGGGGGIRGGLPGGRRSQTFGGSININGRTTHFGSGTHDADFGGAGGAPDLFSMLMGGGGAHGGRGGPQMGGPLGMLSMLFDPANARSGDAVFSQEAFDRVMSQLMDQNQQNGAPPASEDLINRLPKKPLNKSMAGDDGKAECSICMDNVDIGAQVTYLPCNHWFHFECIESWLKEHDTCPHCRKPITPEDQRNQNRQPGQRRSSRRSSSMATPFSQIPQAGSGQNPFTVPGSPSGIRAAREQYFGRERRDPDQDRPSSERRSSRRSTGSHDAGGGGGGGGGTGVGGWIRSHMPFS